MPEYLCYFSCCKVQDLSSVRRWEQQGRGAEIEEAIIEEFKAHFHGKLIQPKDENYPNSMPYPTLQAAFDELYPPGLQWYWKGDFINELSDEAVHLDIKYAYEMPTMLSAMLYYPIDGKPHQAGPSDTPWAYRQAKWSKAIVGVDPDPQNAEAITAWAREYWEPQRPHSENGAYI